MEMEEAKSVVRWEKFMPKMVMRVLLVEGDDSTRQIITALLTKCSYKVAAVADGLKAWELLKARPHNIDLILTELDLPSVSGFSLLTLVAEHQLCKNIPIIIMSAHDSLNTVYKCMLRGAADFLLKPVRKNELNNLWQHVWRRQTSLTQGPQAVDNATGNHSTGYEACIRRNRECIHKGSDAQSSCPKPDLEAEEANLEHRQDLAQINQNKYISSDTDMHKVDQCVKESDQMPVHDNEARGSAAVPNTNAVNITSLRDNAAAKSQQGCSNVTSEAFDKNNAHTNSSREAIDLIGAFDRYPKCSYKTLGSTFDTNMVDSSSLDLTLRRSHPSGSVNQVTDDGRRLEQSDASAFSRYVSRTIQPLHSTSASICNQQRGCETRSDKHISHQPLDYNSDTRAPGFSPDNNTISLTTSQLGQIVNQFPRPRQRVIPVTVPLRGVNFDSLSAASAFSSVLSSPMFMQSRHSPLRSLNSSSHKDPSFQVNQTYLYDPQTPSSPQLQYVTDQNIHNASTDRMEHKQGHKPDLSEDRGHFSSATDQSGSSSNDTLNRFNSFNSGSNGNVNSVPNIKLGPESGNESTQDGSCHRSSQREAALSKFRMKRKDRCYEKKVRYESRKKLAEQRPRVKGQFVRQLQTGGPLIETDDHIFNSRVR